MSGTRRFRTYPVVALLAPLALAAGCRRSSEKQEPPETVATSAAPGSLVCVEQEMSDGCILCAGKDEQAPFLEPDQSRPVLCDPKDDENCVEFCSVLTPACALPWSKGPSCVVDSVMEFRRALFNRQAADRPEVFLVGRTVDDAGKRIEGARIRVWLSRGPWPELVPLLEESSGKDGVFRIPLRSGPWAYTLRISHPGRATSLVDRVPPEKLERQAGGAPKFTYRLGPEQVLRGRVIDLATQLPVEGAVVRAARTPDEPIESGEATTAADGGFSLGGLEARRYFLRVSKFGWRPFSEKSPRTAPAQRVTLMLVRANVIRGVVVDADGEPEPNATVAAVLASAPGVPSTPITWTTDSDGRFAQERRDPGIYYLWAKRGDMMSYPPTRIELTENQQLTEVKMVLSHKGARVIGQVVAEGGEGWRKDLNVMLVSRSPLTFPGRNAGARVDRTGHFVISGVLPGRYRMAVQAGPRLLSITRGPRDVEVPIDPGSSVTLKEPLVIRPQSEE
jgi:hypothetical protein